MAASSRERLTRALNCEKPDYVPCSFMLFNALRAKYDNDFDFFEAQMELGLDTVVYLPLIERHVGETVDYETLIGPPIRLDPRVRVREWKEDGPPGTDPILHKEYVTPDGTLKMEVRKTSDWLWADQLPILNDWVTSRSKKFIVNSKDDLRRLKHILTPPRSEDIKEFREKSRKAKQFAEKHDLLTAGMWGVGLEAAIWITPMEFVMTQCVEDPAFVEELAELLETWNRARMEIFLDFGIDFFVRRGWYEGVDFFSPRHFRKFILPSLKREARLCHEAGAKFTYTLARGSLPIIDQVLDAKVDALICVDPVMDPYMDMQVLKEKVGNRMCLWGGVNETLTVQSGDEKQIRDAVDKAIRILGKDGGLILCPVENVLLTSEESWRNVMKFIAIWKEMRGKA